MLHDANRNCDYYLYFWVPYINCFQFAHTLLIECRNNISLCIILTEYAYGESFVGGTGAGQVSPRLPLVSGIPGLIALIDVSTVSFKILISLFRIH